MRVYWVFGASGPLGNTLVRKFAKEDTVITFSRGEICLQDHAKTHFKVDFADDNALRKAIGEAILLHGFPEGAAFCQRYRGKKSDVLSSDLCHGIQVEIGPTIALLDRLEDWPIGKNLSIVMFTSVANEQINPDISLDYHMLKAATASFVRYQAMVFRNSDVRINAIVLGEFLKYPIDTYSLLEKKKFESISRISNIGRVGTVHDIVLLAQLLLVNPSLALNGQLIHLDGGVTQLASEALVRDIINRGF